MRISFASHLVVFAFAIALAPGLAVAMPFGFELTLSGDPNLTTYQLTNVGDVDGADIVEFELDLGFGNRGFDPDNSNFSLNNTGAEVGLRVRKPNSPFHSRELRFEYTDFQPGEFHTFSADLDGFPEGDIFVDYRTTFFNNGSDANARVTVKFSDGEVLRLTFPDEGIKDSYLFTNIVIPPEPEPEPEEPPAAVTSPGVLALMGGGFLSLTLMRRR